MRLFLNDLKVSEIMITLIEREKGFFTQNNSGMP